MTGYGETYTKNCQTVEHTFLATYPHPQTPCAAQDVLCAVDRCFAAITFGDFAFSEEDYRTPS